MADRLNRADDFEFERAGVAPRPASFSRVFLQGASGVYNWITGVGFVLRPAFATAVDPDRRGRRAPP